MKINKSPWILLILAFFTFSCQEELIEPEATESSVGPSVFETDRQQPNDNCTSDFYYYNKDKIMLGSVLTDKIIIGFPDGYTLKQKSNFVAKSKLLKSIDSEYNTGSADATIIILKAGLTCAEVENLLTQLEEEPEVRYASPFYTLVQGESIMGITNQFIVNLKTNTSLEYLQQLITKTNTKLIEQIGDFTYILSADKASDGNALEMANFFSEQPKIESSEPDFLYIYTSIQATNN